MARENDFFEVRIPRDEMLDLHLWRTKDALLEVVDDCLGFVRKNERQRFEHELGEADVSELEQKLDHAFETGGTLLLNRL